MAAREIIQRRKGKQEATSVRHQGSGVSAQDKDGGEGRGGHKSTDELLMH